MMPAHDPIKPARPYGHSQPGFTVLEIVVVLVLMSIITAVVLGRSITTADVDVVSQTDKIRNHLRFAQSMAMKRSDRIWGIRFTGSQYWFFSITKTEPPVTEEIRLPGGEYSGGSTRINYSDLGVSLTILGLPAATIYFDDIGKPYTRYVDAEDNDALGSDAIINVGASGASRNIQIKPETGYIL